MNRPKITKQTLKELCGDLWTKQSQKQSNINDNKNENDDALSPAVTQTDAVVTQEEENEMGM